MFNTAKLQNIFYPRFNKTLTLTLTLIMLQIPQKTKNLFKLFPLCHSQLAFTICVGLGGVAEKGKDTSVENPYCLSDSEFRDFQRGASAFLA